VSGSLPAIVIGLALILQTAAPAPGPAPQRFKSSVDVVQVDVSATDSNGRPITDLKAEDFELRVDNRPRSISSIQFVSVPSAPASAPAPDVKPTAYSTNADAAGGRLIMVVIDRSSIVAGRAKAAIDAASRFVGQLNRADRVALASIPEGPQVTFTADHALVQRRIEEIDGIALANPANHNLGISDAMAFERKNDLEMQNVFDRECGSPSVGVGGRGGGGGGQSDILTCRNDVKSEALVISQDARERARNSITGLRALLDSLPPSQTPKMMVLISEGLLVDRELAQLSWLDAKAAAAHVTIYSLLLERSPTDASERRPPAQPAADRALQEQGLARLADATRGDVFRVMSNSDFAFQRLANELSGYYLLGFAPEESDRGARPHNIAVTVKRRGVTVRSRRQFTMDAPAGKTVEGQIVSLLRDPMPAAEIPIKLSTFSFRDPNHEKMRLLIAAEVDRSINPGGQLSAGYVVVDFDGKLVASQLDLTLKPGEGATEHYFSTVATDPGKYSIKLAIVDDAGRRGSVETLADAHLQQAGPIRATDLLIADASTTNSTLPLEPVIGGEITGKVLHGYMELFAETADALKDASVTFEIASATSPAALERVPVELTMAKETTRCRIAAGRVNIAKLPAGDYVARAVIAVGLDAVGEVKRPFKIVRPAASQ
jgi:VWFA-related protein